jgi:hypothetical protein
MNLVKENFENSIIDIAMFFIKLFAIVAGCFLILFLIIVASYSRFIGDIFGSASGLLILLGVSPIITIIIVYHSFKLSAKKMRLNSRVFGKAKNLTAIFSLFSLIILSGAGNLYTGERNIQDTAQHNLFEIFNEMPVLFLDSFIVVYVIPMLFAMLTAIFILFEKYN